MTLVTMYVCIINCYDMLTFSIIFCDIILIESRLQYMPREKRSAMSVSLNQPPRHILFVLSLVPHQRYGSIFIYSYTQGIFFIQNGIY